MKISRKPNATRKPPEPSGEDTFQGGAHAILEWFDLKGPRGCGFFRIVDDEIVFQRGYFDKLSFLRQQGLPIATE